MKFSHKRLTPIWFIIILALLSGCIPIQKSDITLTIQRQENWHLDIVLVPELGYEGVVVAQLNQAIGSGELNKLHVQAQVSQQKPLSNGNVPVKLSMKGQGYDSLNSVVGENMITVDNTNGRKILHFHSTLAQQYAAGSTSFTLVGGSILDHNGTAISSHTVMWQDYYGDMQASMSEPPFLPYWIYFVAIGLCCLSVLAVIFLAIGLRARNKNPRIPQKPELQPVRIEGRVCVQCRSAIPGNADYCPHCGARQS